MIRRLRFRQIQLEVERAVNEAFTIAKQNQTNNDYYLFLSVAQYVEMHAGGRYSPYVVDYRLDNHNDELRLNTLIEYLNHQYNFNGANTVDTGFTITLELMIYSHMCESKPFLKQLKRIADLVESNRYNWNIEIPDFGKHDFIRNEVRDVFKNRNLQISDVMTKGYHSQLRNAFAHSDYSLELDTPKIELLNYSGEGWQIRNLPFDEWTERFCYTFLLGYNIHNKFQEERQNLESGEYQVKLKNATGNDFDGILIYDKQHNSFSARPLTPT